MIHYRSFTVALSLLVLTAGCSSENDVAQQLAEGNRYFEAGAYNEAEVHYLNVLKASSEEPTALARMGIMYQEQGRISRTFPILLRAHDLNPQNLAVRTKLGLLYLSGGRFEEARQQADAILEADPRHRDAPLILAEAARSEAEVASAVTRLEELAEAGNSSAIVGLASLRMRQGDTTAGRELAERALAQSPEEVHAHLLLAQLHQNQNELEQAAASFARAAELSPPRGLARLAYARFLRQRGDIEAAKKVLTEVTVAAPDALPAWLLRAEIAAGERDYEAALAHVNRALARDSEHPNARVLRARINLAQGKTDQAVTELQSVIQAFPQAYEPQLQLGHTYVVAENLHEATQAYTRAVALAPEQTEPVLALAGIHLRRGDARAAVGALEPLLEKHPGLVPARLLLAEAYRVTGAVDRALTVLEPVQKAAPDNPQLLSMMATLQARGGDTEAARASFERSHELRPNASTVEQLINLDLRAGQVEAARARAEAQLREAPEAAESHVLLAKVLIGQREFAPARQALEKAIELRPDVSTAYLMLAQLHMQAGEQSQALQRLNQALEQRAGDQNALLMAAMLHERQGEYEAAVKRYEQLIELHPRNGIALNNVAFIASERLGDQDKALTYAERAREVMPTDANVADTLGWVLYRRGDYTRALALIQESAQRMPNQPTVQFHLGMAQSMTGNDQAATASLQRALDADLAGADAATARDRLALLRVSDETPTDEAMTLAKEALAANPQDPVALLQLAELHERQGRLADALSSVEQAVAASPQNAKAMVTLARLQEKSGDPAKALETAKAARRFAGDDPEIAATLGRLAAAAGDPAWAASLFQEALRVRRNDPELLYDHARAVYRIGRVDEAREAAQNALQAGGVFSRTSEAQAFLQLTSERPEMSEAALQQRLQANPDDLPTLMALAQQQEAKDKSAAVALYARAVQQHPQFAPALRQLAILTARDPAPGAGIVEAALRARSAYPSDMEVAKAVGIHLYRQRDYGQAANLLQRAARERPEDAELFYFLGLAQAENNETARAKEALQRALDLKLTGADADDAQQRLATL